jgi:hypothetical protein
LKRTTSSTYTSLPPPPPGEGSPGLFICGFFQNGRAHLTKGHFKTSLGETARRLIDNRAISLFWVVQGKPHTQSISRSLFIGPGHINVRGALGSLASSFLGDSVRLPRPGLKLAYG